MAKNWVFEQNFDGLEPCGQCTDWILVLQILLLLAHRQTYLMPNVIAQNFARWDTLMYMHQLSYTYMIWVSCDWRRLESTCCELTSRQNIHPFLIFILCGKSKVGIINWRWKADVLLLLSFVRLEIYSVYYRFSL